jgi:Ca-activated chloride channel family protein
VQPKEDLEIKVSNFFGRVSAPVLSDLEIDFGFLQTDYLYPRKLTDLFKGMQVAIIGRYKNPSDLQNITLRLTGKSAKETRSFNYPNLDFPLRSDGNEFLPRLWATRRVGWLLEQIRANGETKELRDEIAELGTRYGIVTPYTSYLATDGSFVATPRDDRQIQELRRRAAKAVNEKSGAGAVQMSVQQNSMQANVTVSADAKAESEQILIQNTSTNQFVANKNFFNQSSVWVDSEFRQEAKLPETNVKFASDEYFDLIAKERALAQYLALGEQVVVVWKGRVYRITN